MDKMIVVEKANAAHVSTQRMLDFMEALEHHPVFENRYFKMLLKNGWDAHTYEIYRANFFYRTELTVKGIAQICARAAANDDQNTLILFSHILHEETGGGRREDCHEVLMEQSHNLYGQIEFGLKPLAVKNAGTTGLIIDETKAYREKIFELISASYPCMLGVAMALESHADRMLSCFRDVFRMSRKKMNGQDYKDKVEIYFNCHIENGVEERHAADARECVLSNCNTEDNISEIIFGAEETLKIQQTMWDGMLRHALNQNNSNILKEVV